MQASNSGGTFDQRFLCIFSWNFYRRCLSTFSIPSCKQIKNDEKLQSRGPALIFLVWKLLEKYESDTTLVRMRSGDHLEDAKMSKKGTSLRRI